MKSFTDLAREFYLAEKGVDIDTVEFMDLPEKRADYDCQRVTGNVNLFEGRLRSPEEANQIITHFMEAPLP